MSLTSKEPTIPSYRERKKVLRKFRGMYFFIQFNAML